VSEARALEVIEQLAQQGVHAKGLSADSRALRPGEVFVAYPGARSDGRRFIADALARGASGVLWERKGFGWDTALDVPNVAVEELHRLSGHIAHVVYSRPSERLKLVGVTGTNGKTSVTHWIARCLGLLGQRCAVIGTLGNGFPGKLVEGLNTTPDGIAFHAILAQFVSAGASAAAMEVSSIGLDQGRVNGARFDTAVFTNLTRDHLEYHKTMEAYAQAKAKLFSVEGLRLAVLNLDDTLGRRIAAALDGSGVKRVGYAQDGKGVAHDLVDATIVAENIAAMPRGLRFDVVTPGGRARVEAPLIGRFNVSNLLAVLATLLGLGVRLADAAATLPRLKPPAGRMEMLGGTAEPLVVVDYAHTPDALEQALLALRETATARSGRLVCVFGCGGERDPGKRPLMGEVAVRSADALWLTSDNPRGEDPSAIIADIVRGAGAQARVVEDRASAIAGAIGSADSADVVLIAGKGHEAYQEAQGARVPFSDVEHAGRALAAQKGARQ
jgi:UDP-N-acetylmuramoyl-L-alanyl-D-glutamate--2,6-diaminopimelate ligase